MLLVVLLIGCYMFVYDPSLTPFRAVDDGPIKKVYPNVADEVIVGYLKKVAWLNQLRQTNRDDARRIRLEATMYRVRPCAFPLLFG